MLVLLILTVLFVAGAMALLSVGYIMGGRRLKGSCGGVPENCECSRAGVGQSCLANVRTRGPTSLLRPVSAQGSVVSRDQRSVSPTNADTRFGRPPVRGMM